MTEAKDIRKKNYPIYLMVAFAGVICIFLSLLFGDKENIWWNTLTHVGQALIIGPTISLILDLPSMINYFKKITIKSLVSESYLNTLQRGKLIELRKKITARIHLKDTQFVEQGLINIDEGVCELLTQHYHERYRQNVTCKFDGDFVIKNIMSKNI